MEEAHWKGTEKIRRILFMGFFSLLILSIGFFIGMGDSLAGAKKRDKAALSSVSGGLSGKKETFHEFLSYRNVSYPSVYPNHFYDAYVYPSNRRGEVLGTIIYIHGGGFVSGTKDIAGENPYFLTPFIEEVKLYKRVILKGKFALYYDIIDEEKLVIIKFFRSTKQKPL